MGTNRRLRFRQNLSPLYQPFYDALCKELDAYWQPFSGWRDAAHQERLYAQGRSEPGSIITNARAWDSPHQYGCASDWTIWTQDGQPIWIKADDPMWREYEAACEKVGLEWGGHFPRIDAVHNELSTSIRWSVVGNIYRDEGYQAAINCIQEHIKK